MLRKYLLALKNPVSYTWFVTATMKSITSMALYSVTRHDEATMLGMLYKYW